MKNLLKFVIFTVAVIAVFIISGCLTRGGEDAEDTEILFTLNDDGESYTLTNVGKDVINPVIPAEYNGLPVTAIGGRAFYNVYYPIGCAGPKYYPASYASLTIPASIKTVQSNAFYETDVKNIIYGGTLAEWCAIDFGDSIFSGKTSLYIDGEEVTEISVDGVEEIKSFAFAGYEKLVSASFGAVQRLGENAFSGCINLETVTAENLTRVGAGCFNGCTSLEKFDISNSPLREIGFKAFAGCLNLTVFTLPETMEDIGGSAFSDCANIFEIFNYSEFNLEEGAQSYGGIAVNAILIHTERNDGLTLIIEENLAYILGGEQPLLAKMPEVAEIILPDELDGKQYALKDGLFRYNTFLETLTLPEFMTSISPNAFYGCKNLVTVQGADITEVGESAFRYCEKLINFDFSHVQKIGDFAFYQCQGLDSINFSDLKEITIGEYAFGVCDKLSELVLPETVVEIKENAFRSCKSLQKVTVLSINAVIERGVFSYCPALETAIIASAEIRTRAFEYSENLSAVTLKEGVKTVNVNAFYGTSVTSLHFPASCENIGLFDVGTTPMFTPNEVTLADGNTVFSYSGGCIIDIEKKTVVIASDYSAVPDDGSVEIIGSAAFFKRKLGEVILPDCVTEVKSDAFSESTITRIEMTGVTGVGLEAFSRCKSLTEVVFGDGLSYLRRAFDYCESLSYIEIPDGCTSLESFSFYRCTSLERVILPSSLKIIPDYCFSGCTALKEVVIPDGVIQIGMSAFKGCTALESVTLSASVKSLLSYCFNETAVEEVVFEGTLEEWEAVYKGATARWIEREVKIICKDGESTFKDE